MLEQFKATLLISFSVLCMMSGAAAATCPGDCDGNASVTVTELIRGVRIALGQARATECQSFDHNSNGQVSIEELVRAVTSALTGCQQGPTPSTPTPPSQTPPTLSTTPTVGSVPTSSPTERTEETPMLRTPTAEERWAAGIVAGYRATALQSAIEILCIEPGEKASLATAAEAATAALSALRDTEDQPGDPGPALRALAEVIQLSASPPVRTDLLLTSYDVAQRLIMGSPLEASVVTAPEVALGILRENVRNSTLPSEVRSDLLLLLHDEETVAHFAATLVATVPNLSEELHGEAARLLADAVALITYFDPRTLLRPFRDRLIQGDVEGALAFVLPEKRPVAREKLAGFIQQSGPAAFGTFLTLNIVPESSHGTVRQFGMLRDDPDGTTAYPFIFSTDCAGTWRIMDF